MQAEDITDIEGVRVWAVQHDAYVTPKWNRQETLNDTLLDMSEKQKDRIESLERKVAKYGGAAFVIGTLLATGLGWFLNHVAAK